MHAPELEKETRAEKESAAGDAAALGLEGWWREEERSSPTESLERREKEEHEGGRAVEGDPVAPAGGRHDLWRAEGLTAAHLFPARSVTLLGQTYAVPAQAEWMLERHYGDWRTVRAQRGEVVADPTALLHGECRFLQILEDSFHIVGDRSHHEAVE